MVIRLQALLEEEQRSGETTRRLAKDSGKVRQRKLKSFLKRFRHRRQSDKRYIYRHKNRNHRLHKDGSPDFRGGPYHGPYRAVTWNAQGLFAAGRKPRKAKWKFVQELATNHDIIFLQETHGTRGRAGVCGTLDAIWTEYPWDSKPIGAI